ncbi:MULTISPECIES: O-antigen ligase family protein [unclassified Pseudomonas]|uniref:O-antigen ligase family protein n=1 Tax=unclassified Pseudomonas TaxID=196821 RepID=UPI0035C1B420
MLDLRTARLVSVLYLGYLWFLFGIVWVPSNKIYQQGLVALLWLPALVGLVMLAKPLFRVWQSNRFFLSLTLMFLGWAAVSMSWSAAEDSTKELKRVAYVALFLVSFLLLAQARPALVWRGLGMAFVGLALSCPISFYLFYIHEMNPLQARLSGIGQAGHPILGSYVMALAVMWGLQFTQDQSWKRVVWGALITLLVAFIVLGQSRGAMLALGLAALSMPLWRGGRVAWTVALVTITLVIIGATLFAPYILARGFSYRPEIFVSSVQMIMENPLFGLGVGSDYRVYTYNFPEGFDHSHNAFTHAAIELGLPGLLLWIGLWLLAFRTAWLERAAWEGRLLLSTLLVSFVALQFDAASLWGSPRAEWFVTWLPIGLAMALALRRPEAAQTAVE